MSGIGAARILRSAAPTGFFALKKALGTCAIHGEQAALLLASDAGGHITGHVLVVDGGATII